MKGRYKRAEERKFKRIALRFGLEKPEYRGVGIQISTHGLFISTNHPIFVTGSRLKIEIDTPDGPLNVTAVVRHAKKVPPQLVQYGRPGMGVEFTDPPPEIRDYLAAL